MARGSRRTARAAVVAGLLLPGMVAGCLGPSDLDSRYGGLEARRGHLAPHEPRVLFTSADADAYPQVAALLDQTFRQTEAGMNLPYTEGQQVVAAFQTRQPAAAWPKDAVNLERDGEPYALKAVPFRE